MMLSRVKALPDAAPPASKFPVLREGVTCWRLADFQRAAFLVDGADYFKAFAAACEMARRTIYIAGWDINSRVKLVRGLANPEDEERYRLGNLLNRLASDRPELDIYILDWDYTVLYALEREMLPTVKLGWSTHRRVRLVMDDAHPIIGSQHQKFAVVDDNLAFAGGLDLTHNRWDTPEHTPHDERRVNPFGVRYRPFHDLQMLVDGQAAASLGELFRNRWQWATGRRPRAPEPGSARPWPQGVPVHARQAKVGICLTLPEYKSRKPVRHVLRLFQESIAAAGRYIYIETQYFTSDAVCGFLCRSLGRERGPEVVLVMPLQSPGWMEQGVMDGLRVRILQRLRQADRHGRLRMYYPFVPNLGDGESMHMHSKVMIADDCFLRIGSANLSNRSMGMDSECDMALECDPEDGKDEALKASISGLLHRLLGEHLGKPPGAVSAAIARHGSLIAAVEGLRGQGRGLKPLERFAPEWVDPDYLDLSPFDPERPMAMDRLIDMYFFDRPTKKRRGKAAYVLPAVILLLLVGLALAWRLGPLGEWLTLDTLMGLGRRLGQTPLEPVLVMGGMAIATVFMVPVLLLIVAVAMVYSPLHGFAYAYGGCLLGAMAGYYVGELLGKEMLRNLGGKRINRLSRKLASTGVISMAIVRNLPVAPFGLVNLIAGASHISFRDYMLGTALGMLPGVLAITLLGDSLGRLIREPSWANVLVTTVVLTLILLAGWWLRRRLARHHEDSAWS